MRFNRRTILTGAIAAASIWASHAAMAQTAFPTKPITIIVPAAAGGPTDTVARLIGESMGRSPRPDHPGRECRRRRRHARHGAGVEVGRRRLHARDLAHRARHRARALRFPQIRRRQRFRSPRPHHRRADDPGVEADTCRQQRDRVRGVDSRQRRQGRLRTCRHRLRLASVHADADEGARRADERDSLSRHRAGDERPAQRPVRRDVRPDHQHHQPDQGRQDQGFCGHDQSQGLVLARPADAR